MAEKKTTAATKKAVPVKAEKVKTTVKAASVSPVKKTKDTPVKVEMTTAVAEKVVKAGTAELTLNVVGIDGKAAGKVTLPAEIFGEKVNKTLLAQAVRVYLANKRQGNASTKTRGEVDGSSKKIYRQKGTGRARHGSLRAPIFVKGGIVFGPKPRDFSLDLPKKMRRKALFSALSAKLLDGEVVVLSGVAEIEPKTKQFATVLKNIGMDGKKRKLLFVTATDVANIKRAARNIEGVNLTAAARLNALEVLNTKHVLLMKEAIDEMKKLFLKA